MSEVILSVIITGAIGIISTIITAVVQSGKNRALMELKMQHQNEKIEILTGRVDIHNNYAQHIPTIENEIKNIKEQIGRIERGN